MLIELALLQKHELAIWINILSAHCDPELRFLVFFCGQHLRYFAQTGDMGGAADLQRALHLRNLFYFVTACFLHQCWLKPSGGLFLLNTGIAILFSLEVLYHYLGLKLGT